MKVNRFEVTIDGVTVRFETYPQAERYADDHGGARVDVVGANRRWQGPSKARTRCLLAVVARDGEVCFAGPLVPEIVCSGRLDGHELLPRARGGNPDDPSNVRLICRGHHDWIHAHPNDAVERGLTIPTREEIP
jgi:hypothetical protein